MPPGLVALEPIFDNNPRLATVVGFSSPSITGHNVHNTP
jgi:hypothetical protein